MNGRRILLMGTGRGGKSLLAANLANEAARRGYTSALHDISPRQQNLLRWQDQAQRNKFKTPQLSVGRGGHLPGYTQGVDLVVVDTPAYNGLDEWFSRVEETIPHCTGAVIIWNPDPSGAWSISDLVTNVARVAPSLQVAVVSNRFRPSKSSKAAFSAIPGRFRPVLVDTVLHERAAFSESFGVGADVMAYAHTDAKARAEFQAVYAELSERFKLPLNHQDAA